MRVAIQGVKASFHDVAAKKFFGSDSMDIIECSTFTRLFQVLDERQADCAVMAVENTIAGTILPNCHLMEKYNVKVVGEVYLRIELCLLALPGEKLEDIRFVHSHPMALHQCQEFLKTLPLVRAMEHADTAESAMEISTKSLSGHASIASSLAAETYGLNILRSNIETNSANFTRFFVLVRDSDYQPVLGANKASIRFEAKHVPGSLVRIIQVFEENSVNMNKIQSVPILGQPYHYSFHVDLEWEKHEDYEKALLEVQNRATNLVNFGEYVGAKKP